MPKNDKLINSLKEIAARNRAENIRVASERDTPEIYAAICYEETGIKLQNN